jgi:HK97 family phage portal protein
MTEFSVNVDLADLQKQVGPLSAASPEGWDAFGSDTWVDMHAWFGWNIEKPRNLDAIGFALAVQCADVKARDIAKAGLALWRQSQREWVELLPAQHWFARLLARKPNASDMTWMEFWRMVVIHLELAQNAYIWKRMNRLGQVLELLPIQPARVRQRVTKTGAVWYELYAESEYELAQQGGESYLLIPGEQIIHLRGRLIDGVNGLSNMVLGHPVFELLGALNRYQAGLFGNDGRTPLVFETEQVFDEETGAVAFNRLKDQLTKRLRNTRQTGDPLLLHAGIKAKNIAINSRDAMTAEAYNATVLRVCGLMQTPPHKIYHYESIKYDNQAAADAQYANDCLIPICVTIEEKLRNGLLPESEWDDTWPEFDRMALMAGDPATLMKVLDAALKVGLIEVNEARVRLPLGLNPLPNGDVRYVPVNMAIIDRQGNVVVQAATGQNAGTGENGGTQPSERGLRLAVDNG